MKYEFKCEMPFNSDRKRMSVVVQEKNSKKLLLLTKGADSSMLDRTKLIDEVSNQIKSNTIT